MTVWVYLPLLFAALFGFAAPAMARALPPAIATWLLSAGGFLAAAGSGTSLALLAFLFVARTPDVAARAGWSRQVLRLHDPVSTPVAALAAITLAVLAARIVRAAAIRAAALRAAYCLAAALPAAGSELAVIDTLDLEAFAVPGRPGRIVATTGLLRRLDAAQRRALLAHERAHLRHHHHAHQSIAILASAANPLLGRLPAAVELSCERWADEDAAHVCPRDTVAAALTRAATGAVRAKPAVVLAAAKSDVVVRLAALHRPAPSPSGWRVGLLVGLLTASAAAVAVAMRDTERLFELAQHAYRAGHR